MSAACAGKLTEEWRDAHSKIDSSRREEFNFLPDEELPELPTSWRWARVKSIGEVKGGKRLPKGQALTDNDTGYPYIRAGNLKDGTVKGQILFLSPEIQKKIARYTVKPGDVYITIVGACIGDSGIVPEIFDGANLTENAAKITNLNGADSSYLALVLRSPFLQSCVLDQIHSGSQGKLALHRISALPVPFPPLEEQKEIVGRVEGLFKFADAIEKWVAAATLRAERLTQAILAKAFRGELVQTEAELARREGREYEPASVLLERIKAEREKAEQNQPKRREKIEAVIHN